MQPTSSPLIHERTVVTGGGSGIGQRTALDLAALGGTVYVLGRREEALADTVARAEGLPGRVVPFTTDVRDPDRVDAAFGRIEDDGGPVGALVHAAAEVAYTPGDRLTPDGFRSVMESVLFGTFVVVSRWSRPLLRDGLPGCAVAVTSNMATQGTPGAAHSSASKAGVEAMFRSLAREWGSRQVRLNLVGPGFIVVDRTASMWDDPQASQHVQDQIATGRPGTVEESVGPILFLLSEAASYMTGEIVVVDGGFRLTPHVLPAWQFEH